MTGVSTILFDLGNTLRHLDHAYVADVITRHAEPVRAADVAAADYHGKAAIDAQLRARRIGTDAARQRPYFDAILDALAVPETARAAIGAEMRAEETRSTMWRVMHEDTPDILSALRARGYTLGVVSNADGRVQAGLASCGLAAHFTAVIDSHVVGVEKPDPRIFHLALQACRAAPAEAIFVGDIYEIDVVGARNAGITALLLDPLGLYGTVDCERIDSLARLLDILPERAAGGGGVV
jgi:putative hydrolase of the HAD superfamily